ncbi:MAG: TRAP transporter TatT component family protein [Bacteriovoracaceae bacterium]
MKRSLEQCLKLLEEVVAAEPNNYEALVYLSRGNYLLADGHYDDEKNKLNYWQVGLSYGEKALATNKDFYKKTVEEKVAVEEALDTLTKNEVEAIYWTAVNLGKWSKLTGVLKAMKYKAKVQKLVKKVEELNPEFFFGAVHRYWGTYYAVAPFFAGGSLEKSLEQYTKTLQIANNYLGSHVLFAENYAVKKGDKELFKKELEFVLNADVNAVPEIRAENAIEKKKAEKLLSKMNEVF